MDLLSLLHKCVVLGDSLQRQLVHQVDLVGLEEINYEVSCAIQNILRQIVHLVEVLPHERLDGEGEGCAVEEDLAAGGQEGDHLVQHPLEVLAQQLVRLVQHQHLAFAHIGNLDTILIEFCHN